MFCFAVGPAAHLARKPSTWCYRSGLGTMRMQATGSRGTCRKVTMILASPIASLSPLAMDLLFPDFLLQEKKNKTLLE